jgi:serine/threonine-protein kinase
MMFQLLTGELPFKGDNPATLMHHIMNVPHPNPKTINPKIITPLVTVIDKCLEKDRNKRYQRAASIHDHLREIRKMINTVIAKSRTKRT